MCPLPAALTPSPATSFEVPAVHPRLWFIEGPSLELARATFSRRYPGGAGFDPRDNPLNNALEYLMTKDAHAAQVAITWAMQTTLPESEVPGPDGSGFDGFAVNGLVAAFVYDWCFDQLRADQRAQLVARWNLYATNQFQRRLGGPSTPATSESWTMLSTVLLWGLAASVESEEARALTAAALSRFDTAFVPYLDGHRGGVLGQGSHYDPISLRQLALAFSTLAAFGRHPLDESVFFKEVVYALAYSTTLAPTPIASSATVPSMHLFPFGDDDYWSTGASAQSLELGAFLSVASSQWANEHVGETAKALLTALRPERETFVSLMPDAGTQGDAGLVNLPLDYLAPGAGQFFARTGWLGSSSALVVQAGELGGGVVAHRDLGSFQVWANGRWVTRETPGRFGTVTGFGGQGTALQDSTLAHNGVLFEGIGAATPGEADSAPQLLRLESTDFDAYLAVDLSGAYRAHGSTRVEGGQLRDDNAHAARVTRELLWVRPLDALVVFDRLQSTAFDRLDVERAVQMTLRPHVATAAAVRKTELMHFELAPVVTGNVASLTTGTEHARLTVLHPTDATFTVVDERDAGTLPAGQFRVEVTASGDADTYFLEVLEWGAEGVAPLDLAVQESTKSFTLELQRADAKVHLEFAKGMQSTGGSFTFTDAQGAHTHALRTDVQPLVLTREGPFWAP